MLASLVPGAEHLTVAADVLRRHPAWVWAALLPVWLATVGAVAAVDGLGHAMRQGLPLHTAGALLGCCLNGVLTVPLQHCVHIPPQVLAGLLAAVALQLQYATAVAFRLPWPRAVSLLIVGFPNLALTAYITGILVLHLWFRVLPKSSLRSLCWRVYTVYAPMLLLPQTLGMLMGCLATCGSSDVCVPRWWCLTSSHGSGLPPAL